MKVTIHKKALSLATARAQGAISERSLAQIGIQVGENGQLTMAANDRVIAVYSYVEAGVQQAGTVFVPAKIFSDIVRELPDGDITMEVVGSQLSISADTATKFNMRLPTLEGIPWREAPTFESENSTIIPADKFSYLIEQVQFCVDQDSPRNYASVVYFHRPDKETCRMVGTDGFRLSYCEVRIPVPDQFLKNGICLSKRALTELLRMSNEGFENINVAVSSDETTLNVSVPGYQIFVRLSAVKYPNYSGVLPKSSPAGVQVSRPQLQQVAKRVLLASDKNRALQLSFSDSSLTLTSKTVGSSEGKETIKLDDYHGPKCQLAVNGKFLSDVFATTQSDRLVLQFSSEDSPVVILPRTEPTACKSKHVLVPIKEAQ